MEVVSRRSTELLRERGKEKEWRRILSSYSSPCSCFHAFTFITFLTNATFLLHRPSSRISFDRCTITCFLLVTTFILSIVIEDLSLILGFVGSIGSTTISFILPGILYSVLHRDEVDNKLVKWAKVLTAWGVLVMVTALSANIWKLTSGGKLGD